VKQDGRIIVRDVKPGSGVAMQFRGDNRGIVRIVLLDEAQSLALWKGNWLGQPRVCLSDANLVFDSGELRLTSTNAADLNVAVIPPPDAVFANTKRLRSRNDGVFKRFTPPAPNAVSMSASFEPVQSAGPPREIPIGKIRQPVATAPEDADFEKAAVWSIKLPSAIDLELNPILRIHYVGDVARVMLNGKLLTDDFYNGNALDIGLRRHAPDILSGDLRVAILPLRKDAPIYMADEARPEFGDSNSVVGLQRIEIIPQYRAPLTAR
jgi:hypothetical protein